MSQVFVVRPGSQTTLADVGRTGQNPGAAMFGFLLFSQLPVCHSARSPMPFSFCCQRLVWQGPKGVGSIGQKDRVQDNNKF